MTSVCEVNYNSYVVSSKSAQQKRLLIVEDDESIRQVMNEALVEHGFQTQLAGSADEAMAQINSFRPHLVLTDYDMPGLTGLEMLRELRQKQNYTTVIFVSGRSDTDLVVKAFQAGADDYIKKPFRLNELIARVEANLRTNDIHHELLEANQKLQSMVEHDYLTGLYNMRSMYDKIDYEIKRARRFKRGVACVMMDMDKFKQVNDNHDHLFGSFVLKEVGRIISESIREVDFAARYGGDEFLIVLTEADKNGAMTFCERLRNKIAAHTFVDGDDSIQLTVSLGFFVVTGELELDARALVRHADHALYKAKESGRNRSVGYDSLPAE